MRQAPRILVISHNVLSKTTAMGKTLSSMLSCVPAENLAQLYFHSEIPTLEQCQNYFRVRDQDVLLSVFRRRINPTIYGKEDIRTDVLTSRIDKGLASKVYQFSRRRTPLIYMMRNLLWTMGKWDTPQLREWLDDFRPDLIFFASGDYSFSYRIAYSISTRLNIPIIMWCCDDYYFSRRYTNTIGGEYVHSDLMRWVKRISERVESVIVIGEKMKQDYATIFSAPIYLTRISAPENHRGKSYEERAGIVYVGGLGVNRICPLLKLGKRLREAHISGYERIDVYSNDKNPATLNQLTEVNGIRFHGGVSAEEVLALLGNARFVLHVESFDENTIERTRYSLSTKIGESLQSGACIIAYGPKNIESIQYLDKNHAAVVLNAANEIGNAISNINSNPNLYEEYIRVAKSLAHENHNKEKNDAMMSEILHLNSERKA